MRRVSASRVQVKSVRNGKKTGNYHIFSKGLGFGFGAFGLA